MSIPKYNQEFEMRNHNSSSTERYKSALDFIANEAGKKDDG